MKTVVVAMSGGVDSSVTAALLKEQGFNVIGMMMRLWSEPGSETENRCCTVDAMNLARKMAAQLEIPFYAIDAKDIFRKTVVQYFIDGYSQGITPNPCLVCNMHIRWDFLLNRALALGADLMATGHYARLWTADSGQRSADSGQAPKDPSEIKLLKAIDQNKDQSYVLHVLKQDQLKHALFPLGNYTKPQVRELARKFDLPVAERSDSQDLCFLGNGTYAEFLERNAPEINQPGPMITPNGRELGQHQGLAYYTIGQRRGLGVAASEPLYVIQKETKNNSLIVGPKNSLGRDQLVARDANWISGAPPDSTFRGEVKIRYKASYAWGEVTPLPENRIKIEFDEQLRDITPGQAAVIYDDDVCLGGGIIE